MVLPGIVGTYNFWVQNILQNVRYGTYLSQMFIGGTFDN